MHTHLTRVHLKGFRNIQDTETTFREGLNIIIGPNGCGKTNFLWLLANIDKEETNKVKISGNLECNVEEMGFWNIEIFNKRNRNNIVEKEFFFESTGFLDADGDYFFEIILSRLLLSYNIPVEIECFSKGNSILLEPLTDNYYIIETENLLLVHLFSNKKFPNYPKILPSELNFEQKTIDILKKYTPIQDIRVEFPQREDEITLINGDEIRISNLMYGFKTNNEWFKWNELSDGTRRIAWIVLNILLTNSKIILIEEPELGIHPLQLNKLMEFIKKESKNKQIIITTHSPEVLNILEADELDRIKLAKYDEVRKTTVIHSIAAEEQARIGKYMKETGFLSDFWLHLDLEGGTL